MKLKNYIICLIAIMKSHTFFLRKKKAIKKIKILEIFKSIINNKFFLLDIFRTKNFKLYKKSIFLF